MTITPEVEAEIARIDTSINHVHADITKTEETISRLVNLNARRRTYLRELGQKRSELLTYELKLDLK